MKRDADDERSKIDKLQSMGRNRFVFIFGVLSFGLPLGLVGALLSFADGRALLIATAAMYGVLGLGAGFVFGRALWWALERRLRILDREVARAGIPELKVEQWGFTHLWYRGSEALRAVGLSCLKWGTAVATIGVLVLWRRGGWNNVLQRPDAIAFAAAGTVICRFAYEMLWHQAVVNEAEVRVTDSRGTERHAPVAVRRLIVELLPRDRLLLNIHWMDDTLRPVTIVGRVPEADATLDALSHAYSVQRRDRRGR